MPLANHRIPPKRQLPPRLAAHPNKTSSTHIFSASIPTRHSSARQCRGASLLDHVRQRRGRLLPSSPGRGASKPRTPELVETLDRKALPTQRIVATRRSTSRRRGSRVKMVGGPPCTTRLPAARRAHSSPAQPLTSAPTKSISFRRRRPHAIPDIDLTLGTAGVLVGFALLVDPGGPPSPALNVLGSELFTSVSGELERRPGIRDASDLGLLGIAHGWAGLLYALLLWCRATGSPASDMILSRLAELASLGEPAAGGLRWRRTLSTHNDDPRYRYLTGWCNGTAGIAFLWTLAERFAGDGLPADSPSGRLSTSSPASSPSTNCAVAVPEKPMQPAAALHRSTGNPRWLRPRVANRAGSNIAGRPGRIGRIALGVQVRVGGHALPGAE